MGSQIMCNSYFWFMSFPPIRLWLLVDPTLDNSLVVWYIWYLSNLSTRVPQMSNVVGTARHQYCASYCSLTRFSFQYILQIPRTIDATPQLLTLLHHSPSDNIPFLSTSTIILADCWTQRADLITEMFSHSRSASIIKVNIKKPVALHNSILVNK